MNCFTKSSATVLLMGFFFISCSGDYPEMESEGCNLDQFQEEMDRPVTLANLSMLLIERVQNDQSTDKITNCLAGLTLNQLTSSLDTEPEKKAFWINVYNANIQIILQDQPKLFDDRNSWFGFNFFSTPQVTIAGYKMSFDDLEHGIMRRSTNKLSLGYMQNWFVADVEKQLRWNNKDPRIHFALNCGAASCPYVATYDPQGVDEQLDLAAKKYLIQTTKYDASTNEAKVTSLISWFRGDFGGLEGAKKILKDYNIIPEDADPSLSFLNYDWTLDLGNFQDL